MSGKGSFESLTVRIIFSLVIIFLSLQLFGGFRDYYSTPGATATAEQTYYFSGDEQVVTLYLQKYSLLPRLKVLVNGESRGSFNSRYVTVAVRSGDVITLDGTFYKRPVDIEILDSSKAVRSPSKGKILHLNGTIISLGKVVTSGE